VSTSKPVASRDLLKLARELKSMISGARRFQTFTTLSLKYGDMQCHTVADNEQ